MKYILLSTVLLLSAISTYGQADSLPQTCALKLSQVPAVRGVKLGMTADEVFALFPGTADNPFLKDALTNAEGYPKFGDATFSIDPNNWANKERYTGVGSYFFHTFDRRVVAMVVHYTGFPNGPRWKTTDDLIQRFSDSFHLPGPKEWVPDPYNNQAKKLKCDGFEVTVIAGDLNSIHFLTRNWEATKKERLAAFDEEKRRGFKP